MTRFLTFLLASTMVLSACAGTEGERDRSLLNSILRGSESRAPEVEEAADLVPFSNGPTEPPVPLEDVQ